MKYYVLTQVYKLMKNKRHIMHRKKENIFKGAYNNKVGTCENKQALCITKCDMKKNGVLNGGI